MTAKEGHPPLPRLLLASWLLALLLTLPARGAHSLLMMNPVSNCIRSAVVQSITSRSQSAESDLRVTADQVRSAGGDAESETGRSTGSSGPETVSIKHDQTR
jgi:hypothetical protein